MRFLRLLACAASFALTTASAMGQDAPPPGPMSAKECGAAYLKVKDDLNACFQTIDDLLSRQNLSSFLDIGEMNRVEELQEKGSNETPIETLEVYLVALQMALGDYTNCMATQGCDPNQTSYMKEGYNVKYVALEKAAFSYCENSAAARLSVLKFSFSCGTSAPQLFAGSSCPWHGMINAQCFNRCQAKPGGDCRDCLSFNAAFVQLCAKGKRTMPFNPAMTANPGVKSNNLDRFHLGPSFVTTDPSLPNQRGGGKAVQGGSSKAKTTTTLAKPSTDATKPPRNQLFLDRSPAEQIK